MRLHKCWTTTYLLRAGIQHKRPTKDYSIESNSLKRRIQIFISWVFNSFNSRNNILSVVTKEMFISMSKKESKLQILKGSCVLFCFVWFSFKADVSLTLWQGRPMKATATKSTSYWPCMMLLLLLSVTGLGFWIIWWKEKCQLR